MKGEFRMGPFARRVENRPAQSILKEKYGSAYFLRQTPLKERYYALAEIAHIAGRSKAAKTMALYAAIEGFIKEARPPFGFLKAYGMNDSDSRLARAIAITVCIKIGANERAGRMREEVGMTNEKIGNLVLAWTPSSRFIKRRAKEVAFPELPAEGVQRDFYYGLRNGTKDASYLAETEPSLSVEKKALDNLAMAMFGTDAAECF